MKFEVDRRTLIIGLVALIIVITVIVIIVRSRSNYKFPVPAAEAGAGTPGGTLTGAIADCTLNYRMALQQGLTDSTPPKAKCIQDAVNTYFGSKCPDIVAGKAPGSTIAASDDVKILYTNYSGIQLTKADGTSKTSVPTGGGDAAAVTSSAEYVRFSFPTNVPAYITPTVISMARKADLTGPTRKYISLACTGFYTPAADGLPDPSSTYGTWQKFTSAPTTGYGFYSPYVTGPKIYEWALKAGTPIAVTEELAADTTPATSTSRTIKVSSVPSTVAANTKIKLGGVSYSGDLTVTATSAAGTITFSYSPQTFPVIPVGTSVNKSTAVAVNMIAFGSGAAVSVPSPASTQATNSFTLQLASALDDSLSVGSQVLLSGTAFTVPITISQYTTGSTSVILSTGLTSQIIPALPAGCTIENALDIPYATPLISTPGVYVATTRPAGTPATTAMTVNAAPSGTAPTQVTMPTLPGAAGTATYNVTFSGTQMTFASASNPTVEVPVGTPIFTTAGVPVTTAATTNPLYTKIGTLTVSTGTQKMLNWQLAQSYGPGTYSGGSVTWGS